MTQTALQRLVQSGILVPSHNARKRIIQEDQALKALDRKKVYLSKYNCILRHIFLLALRHGFDINSNCVHYSFVEVTISISGFEKEELIAVVKSRHRKKYKDISPTEREENILNQVLSFYNQHTKIEIYCNA